MTDTIQIKRALISVSNKSGLIDFADSEDCVPLLLQQPQKQILIQQGTWQQPVAIVFVPQQSCFSLA